MLSRNSRRALSFAKKAESQSALYNELSNIYGWSHAETLSACSSLVEQRYATLKKNYSVNGIETVIGITLTEKGRNSSTFFWAHAGQYVFANIVVPIIVAFITALLTTLAIR